MSNDPDAVVVENHYEPNRPAARMHGSDARVIVCVGGLGSGKSYAVVREIELTAIQYPGIPMAMYRKTLPALRDSTLHEFKDTVDDNLGIWRERDMQWKFINKSFMNFRGLDSASKAKSTNYGLIILEEAEEFTLDEFRKLNERVRSIRKKGDSRAPFPLRIIVVLNPVDDTHWIYDEFVTNFDAWNTEEAGGLEVIRFSTYDNIDNLPPGYISQITVGMSPEEIDRYVNGHWGTLVKGTPVYANILNADLHLRTVDRFPGQTLIRGWDFGFNHPAVSFRLVDNKGRMNIAHEMMGEKIDLVDFVPEVIERTMQKFGPNVQIIDYGDPRGHDKGPSADKTCFDVLTDFGINAIGERGARSYVESGITKVKKEFSLLIDGVPKLTIDPECSLLRAAYFGRYVRGDDGSPVKEGYFEHICFVGETITVTSDGEKRLDQLKVGNMVLTRNGYRPVKSIYSYDADVITSQGLTGTAEHPVMTQDGWKRLDMLTDADRYVSVSECEKWLYLTKSNSILTKLITSAALSITSLAFAIFTDTFGNKLMARFQKVIISIIGTITQRTTVLKTLSYYPLKSIENTTQDQRRLSFWRKTKLANGTVVPMATSGIKSMVEELWSLCRYSLSLVSSAIQSLVTRPLLCVSGSVPINVRLNTDESLESMTFKDCAPAENHSQSISTQRKVYAISVCGQHEYFANGKLVSNCDADRYISHHHAMNDAVGVAMARRKEKRHEDIFKRNRHTGY